MFLQNLLQQYLILRKKTTSKLEWLLKAAVKISVSWMQGNCGAGTSMLYSFQRLSAISFTRRIRQKIICHEVRRKVFLWINNWINIGNKMGVNSAFTLMSNPVVPQGSMLQPVLFGRLGTDLERGSTAKDTAP